jgi:four helix bundle protein
MNESKASHLNARTKTFALQIIQLYALLPKSPEAQVLGKQLLRSGTSVGAQYREACRARSRSEFVSKIECGLQELEETKYWLELLIDSGIDSGAGVETLLQEADELMAILVASVKTVKHKSAK